MNHSRAGPLRVVGKVLHVLGRVEGDMGDVDFEVLVMVGFASIAVQSEGFPLGRKGGVGDKVGEGVTTSGLVGWEWVRGCGL